MLLFIPLIPRPLHLAFVHAKLKTSREHYEKLVDNFPQPVFTHFLPYYFLIVFECCKIEYIINLLQRSSYGRPTSKLVP